MLRPHFFANMQNDPNETIETVGIEGFGDKVAYGCF
jgi:hypothetical protein